MSEYCSDCSPFKNNFDIDLDKIASKLRKGETVEFICEGCSNRLLYKDTSNKIFIGKFHKGEIKYTPLLP